MQATKPKLRTAPSTWTVYQTMFSDHLEATNMAPMTVRTYGIAVDQLGEYLSAQGMPHDPTLVTREHMIEWMRYLQRSKADGGQGITAQTTLQRYRSVSRLFAFLVDIDEIKDSPMAKMKPPRVPEKQVPVISTDNLKALFKACSGSGFEERRDKAIMSLFMDTGMRLAEMAGINLIGLDLTDQKVVTVMGKGRRERTLRLLPEVRKDINLYLLVRPKHPHAADAALWLGKRGRLLGSGIYQTLQRRCEEAGIARIHPHQFRHTFANGWLRNGGNEGDLMNTTGWRSRQMVDRYGAAVAGERAREAHDTFSPRRGL